MLIKIKIEELQNLIFKALQKKYDAEDSQLITEVLIFAELSGITSHGVVRLFAGDTGVLSYQPKAKPQVIERTTVSKVIDSRGNPGILAAQVALKIALQLAGAHGVGVVGTKGAFSTSGCLAYYLEQIALRNFIGIVMAESPLFVAPFGGIEPIFGTNPLSFGIPAAGPPLIFDMATSAITLGDIVRAKELGEPLPENSAIDREGNPTTNPVKAYDGATLSFGNSYKSSGQAMMVEILAGIWPGAGFGGINKSDGWGNTLIVFSPALLSDVNEFKAKVTQLVERVRNSRTKDGNKIRIVGEAAQQKRAAALKNGSSEIHEVLLAKLREAAA
ncbi:Ldh family oxidoreductase [Candidatus Roizmanbacteria bacterium]|nr:Ldh family oxidoreductase [Candidatus Roizmanbacteria bacterium]